MNIYQKIIEVRKTIDCFEKDSKSYGYDYVSGSQILEKIKGKIDELGIVLEPHVKHEKGKYFVHDYTNIDKYGKEKRTISYIVDVPMEYHWVNADDPQDRIICDWALYGQQDDISKAFGSGLTYSERYFLLKYFGVPTDNMDPDKKGKNSKSGKDANLVAEISNIDTEAKRINENAKLKEQLIPTIKKHHTVANYNGIKDINVAKALLEDLKKIK